MKDINKISTWRQARFVDQPRYNNWSKADKEHANFQESFNVRPSDTGNVICITLDPEDAKWIASRLNLASRIEKMVRFASVNKLRSDDVLEQIKEFLKYDNSDNSNEDFEKKGQIIIIP